MVVLAYPRILPITRSIEIYDNSITTRTTFFYPKIVNLTGIYQLEPYIEIEKNL